MGLVLGGLWPQAPLHAVATDRYQDFAIATGFVDENIEALYFLDFLTGNLQAAVLSVQTGQFNSFYQINIIQDLEIDASKNPRYMMVTGMANLRRGTNQTRPSAAVVYIAEATSGRVVAYALPWTPSRQAAGNTSEGPLYKIAVTQFRTAAVRD
jgi:hypothetical protein